MSDSEKPEADYSQTDAVSREDGELRVEMEALQKGGKADIEGLAQKADSE